MSTSFKSTSEDETPLPKTSNRKRLHISELNNEATRPKKSTLVISDSSDSDEDLDQNGFLLSPHSFISVSDAFELKKIHRIFEHLPKSINDTIYKGGEKWQIFLDEVTAGSEKVRMILQETKSKDPLFKKSSEYKNLKLTKNYLTKFCYKFGMCMVTNGVGAVLIAYLSTSVSEVILGPDLTCELKAQLQSMKSMLKSFFNKSGRGWLQSTSRNYRSYGKRNFKPFYNNKFKKNFNASSSKK